MTQNSTIQRPIIALFEPDIPQNTAAIIRTCSCLGANLEIIEPCGFLLNDKRFKRVVMDYMDEKDIKFYKSADDFFTSNILARIKIGGGSYQVLYENNEDGIERSRKYSKPINLRKMRIKLLNLHGKLAEINNMDYSLVFEVVQRFVDD